jgi:uncharacterized protein with NAD-binding domain and iron-sulfur cluster
MGGKVAILGSGVAGMTAAHELAERGFDVEVFERRGAPGGKARSMPKPRSGTDGRPALPGEHGFRFIPGYYRHLPDTLRRIPCRADGACPPGHAVIDHLVATTEMQVARRDSQPEKFRFTPMGPFRSELLRALYFSFFDYRRKLGIDSTDFALFVLRLANVIRGSRESWFDRFERMSWRHLSAMDEYPHSSPYRKYLARGLTRTMVAARAEEITARTAACTAVKLLQSIAEGGGRGDCVLDGPTSEVWIEPWRDHLRDMGVKFRFRHEVKHILCANGQITGVEVVGPGGETREIKARYYVCALPQEVMIDPLVSDGMREAERRFSTLHLLPMAWMNGVMFYLREDVKQVHGHTIYVDSNWALTSISQGQFWKTNLEERGDGRAKGILSVDVSDWKHGEWKSQVASRSSKRQIAEGVLGQLREHLDQASNEQIEPANVHSWFMDPAITWPNPSKTANAEPLLINRPGSWQLRPQAATGIENLFMAADYAQTDTDLACMEGANEAARKAVNAILFWHGDGIPARTWEWNPPFIQATRAIDSQMDRVGRLARSVTPDWLTSRLENEISSRIGARAADKMVLAEIVQPEALPDQLLTQRERETLGNELLYSPDDTLVELEGRFRRSREELPERIRQELEK